MGIIKTDFMRGMRCVKMLWLDKHKPNLRGISSAVKNRLGDAMTLVTGQWQYLRVTRKLWRKYEGS